MWVRAAGCAEPVLQRWARLRRVCTDVRSLKAMQGAACSVLGRQRSLRCWNRGTATHLLVQCRKSCFCPAEQKMPDC